MTRAIQWKVLIGLTTQHICALENRTFYYARSCYCVSYIWNIHLLCVAQFFSLAKKFTRVQLNGYAHFSIYRYCCKRAHYKFSFHLHLHWSVSRQQETELKTCYSCLVCSILLSRIRPDRIECVPSEIR